MITSETIWISNIHPDNVHQHKIKNLNSKHLANIIHFMKTVDQSIHGHDAIDRILIIQAMRDEANKRELTIEFLNGAPYHYDPYAPHIELV
jgi:hypothetical protein